jgi:dipeptidyl aminopeptidase/acylaminoacyl peptidase
MQPSDIASLIWVSSPTVAPDGATVAFVVSRVDEDDNTYRSQIWLAACDGSTPPRPFTSGEHTDANPAWSPDGSQLAFTSTRGDGDKGDKSGPKATLHVAPVLTGGEVVRLAALTEGAGELRWSPDGRLIAFTSRTRNEGYEDEDRKQPPRRVTRLFSRLDNVGHTVDRPQHVYVVPADGSAEPRNLTPGEHEFSGPAWSPDSSTLVVSGAAHDTWDLDLKVDLHLIDVATGTISSRTRQTGAYAMPSVAPGGARVAFVGTDDVDSFPRNQHVAVGSMRDEGHIWVTSSIDRTFAPFPGARSPIWIDDETLLLSMEDRGDVHLYLAAADGSSAPRPLWKGRGAVTGLDEAAGTVAFTMTTSERPGELFVLDDGEARRLTAVTDGFVASTSPRDPDRFTVPSTDGTVEIDTWLLTPPDFDAERSYPMLLNVHGGPFTQYANSFFDEVQMQAAAGYVVAWCNPRGSSGREESYGRAIVGPAFGGTGWGSVDFDDVMAVADHIVEYHPYVDADRLGILGGSYGGYMTSWTIGHTDRFKAAVSERAVNNLASLEWSSDAAGAFRTTFGSSHLDDPDLYARMSPIRYVRDIHTPLLILHSEQDLRCPIEQADQLFVALRLLERDVELVRFPAESHELSRSGSPVHRRQRAEIILDFFKRHLKPES